MLTIREISDTRQAARVKCVLASVLDSARRIDAVPIFPKPLPSSRVCSIESSVTLVAENDANL